jgi:hypothetical protein
MIEKSTIEKPRTFNADLANLPAALAPLIPQQRWVVWSWEWREKRPKTETGGKWTKPPHQAHNPSLFAKSDDPSTWGSYADAIAAVTAGNADGIGFMLLKSEIAAGDLDHCVDPETGMIDGWAQKLRTEANGAYCEITVSGRGLRVIGISNGNKVHRKFTFNRETGAGLELYRNAARYITISGREIGSCVKLPPFDDFVDTMFARYGAAKSEAKGTTGAKNGTENNSGAFDFNSAGPQSQSNPQSIDYDEVIKNGAPEGQRSELFQGCVWHLAATGKSVEEITEELAQYPNGIGEKYADRLAEEVARSYGKYRSQKFAAATGASAASTAASNSWPQIYVLAGQLPRVVNEAETALLDASGDREVYQRGGLVVRPILSKLKASDNRDTWAWRIIEVTLPHMVEMLTCAAQFLKWDAPDRRRSFPLTPRTRSLRPTCTVKVAGNCRSFSASPIRRSCARTAPSASSRDTMRQAACYASSTITFRRSRKNRAVMMPRRRWQSLSN